MLLCWLCILVFDDWLVCYVGIVMYIRLLVLFDCVLLIIYGWVVHACWLVGFTMLWSCGIFSVLRFIVWCYWLAFSG